MTIKELLMKTNVQMMVDKFREIASICERRDYPVEELVEIERIAEEALSIPLRNCDVYGAGDDASDAEMNAWHSFSGPRGGPDASTEEYERWLFDLADCRK